MSSASTTTPTSTSTPLPRPSTNARMPAKKSKIVILRLAPDALRRAVPQQTQEDTKPASSSTPSASSSATATPDEPAAAAAVDNAAAAAPSAPSQPQSDSADTPAPNGTPADGASSSVPPANGAKRKGVPGPKPGTKRTLQQTVDANGVPKPRGKPGPKKKPRPGDMVDGVPFSGPAPTTAAKMNPKANQGAINANLRALDRTGKPCRRWERKGFQLRSFTGVSWGVASWKAPPKTRAELDGDVKSDTSSDGAKQAGGGSSAVLSEGSTGRNGDTPMADAVVGSSPAPVGAAA